MKTTTKEIGTVFVDAGCIWIGDPCYVLGKDSTHGPEDWSSYCDLLADKGHWHSDESYIEPLGRGIGMHVQTLYGDGEYPLIAEFNASGQITKVTVDFDPGDDY